MKKQTDPLTNYRKIMQKNNRNDDELMELLENEELAEEVYHATPIEEPAPAAPKKISYLYIFTLVSVCCDVYFFYKLIAHHELRLVPLIVSIICMIVYYILKKHEN